MPLDAYTNCNPHKITLDMNTVLWHNLGMEETNMNNRKVAARERRAAIRDAYASAGMVKVRGNLGGTYYE